MRWPIETDAHVLVDARAGVLDQVPAEHVHGLAHQVRQADQSQIEGSSSENRHLEAAPMTGRIDRVDELAQEHGNGRVAGAGQAHDQEGAAQSPAMPPGNQPPDLTASPTYLAQLTPDCRHSSGPLMESFLPCFPLQWQSLPIRSITSSKAVELSAKVISRVHGRCQCRSRI